MQQHPVGDVFTYQPAQNTTAAYVPPHRQVRCNASANPEAMVRVVICLITSSARVLGLLPAF